MPDFVQQQYAQIYLQLGFERRELFALLANRYAPQQVLYPGSSIHITPSFAFRHVVYIDKSPLAARFFSYPEQVDALIEQQKSYRGKSYWQFLAADFQTSLPLPCQGYDLLISLFSGPQIRACEKYLKAGGLILSCSLFSDQETLQSQPQYQLLAWIQYRQQRYQFQTTAPPAKNRSSRLQKHAGGFRYQDQEIYYLYQKKAKN